VTPRSVTDTRYLPAGASPQVPNGREVRLTVTATVMRTDPVCLKHVSTEETCHECQQIWPADQQLPGSATRFLHLPADTPRSAPRSTPHYPILTFVFALQ